MDLTAIRLRIDDGAAVEVDAYEANYVNNLYLSLRGLSKTLNGTAKQFCFYNDADGAFRIETGKSYDPSLEPEALREEGAGPETTTYMSESACWMMKDGESVIYYTFADYILEDVYMSLLDVQLMLDLHLVYDGGSYRLDTKAHFTADLEELKSRGYFDYLHGVLLGNVDTGEILFSCNADEAVPIASTTKLMTYMVAMRMIELGKLREDDIVTVSANAARMSLSDDSVVYLYEGEEATVYELMCAMLIGSSNECALALAEHIAGTEEAFVELMNAMAFRLGMESAVFYNAHGLPAYLPGDVTAMVENHMSAQDMFRLARAVLLKYPQVAEITSEKVLWLDYLWTTVYNTNSLLNNMSDLIGLKTGTTDAAGKCLVAARKVKREGEEQTLVAIVFGAEFNKDRVEMAELLLKSVGE